MFKLQVVYEDGGKRYIFDFDAIVAKILTEQQTNTIKIAVKKEIQKL